MAEKRDRSSWRRGTAAWAGTSLFVLGGVFVAFAVLWHLGLAPGSLVIAPEPVALAGSEDAREAALSDSDLAALLSPEPAPTPVVRPSEPAPAALTPVAPVVRPTATPEPLPMLTPADAPDRTMAALSPRPGWAQRLEIPSISLDTEVVQGGIVQQRGQPVWQTIPFVAVHYGSHTALVGARGNAVISGHVVTLYEGNVFRALYRVNLGDEVHVWDERDTVHIYRVVKVRLVHPSDISVMDPTPDATLTLITCGGAFDPVSEQFADRLVVTAKLVS